MEELMCRKQNNTHQNCSKCECFVITIIVILLNMVLELAFTDFDFCPCSSMKKIIQILGKLRLDLKGKYKTVA